MEQKRYIVFENDCMDVMYDDITEQELLKTYNSMVKGVNEDCDENYPIANNITELLKECTNMWGWIVKDKAEVCNKEVLFLVEQALKFNSSWSCATQRVDGVGYYSLSIKPLYMGDTDILIQVVANKMCCSGCSDNGIRIVERYKVSKYAFSSIENLCKFLVSSISNKFGKSYMGKSYSRKIEYIQF